MEDLTEKEMEQLRKIIRRFDDDTINWLADARRCMKRIDFEALHKLMRETNELHELTLNLRASRRTQARVHSIASFFRDLSFLVLGLSGILYFWHEYMVK